MYKPSTSAYQQQQLTTASPLEIIVMLYDKAIVTLKECIEKLEQRQIDASWQKSAKVTDIILHLHAMLDHEKGGIVSENLDQIYSYILIKIPEIHITLNKQPGVECIKILENLHDSWKEILNKVAKNEINLEDEIRKASKDIIKPATKVAAPQTGSETPETTTSRPTITISA